MKRGQIAVPAILILFLVLFLFYLLWVQPSGRQSLIPGYDEGANTTTSGTGGTVAAAVNRSLLRTDVGWIGRLTGNLISNKTFYDVNVSYASSESALDSRDSLSLHASALIPGYYVLNYDKKSSTDRVTVDFVVSGVTGTPLLRVESDGDTYYSSSVVGGEHVSVSIPAAAMKDSGNDLRITCAFQGFSFWEMQGCDLSNLTVDSVSYDGSKAVVVKDLDITNADLEADTVKAAFLVTDSATASPLTISINNVTLAQGSYEPSDAHYLAQDSAASYDLVGGPNHLVISTDKGGFYYLKDLSIYLYAPQTDESTSTLSFNVPTDVYSKATQLKISFNVDEILNNLGGIEFMFAQHGVFFITPDKIHTGENSFTVSKDGVNCQNEQCFSSGGNQLQISSYNGRYKISNLSIEWQ